MRHSHSAFLLASAGALCLAWTAPARAQAPDPAPPTTTTTTTPPPPVDAAPVATPEGAAAPLSPAPAAQGAQTTKTVNPDGSVTTTTIVTTPIVMQANPTSTTRTTSFLTGERPVLEGPLAPPVNSLEMTLGTVYEQPFGRVAQGQTINDVAGAGGGVHLGLAYRLAPELSLGLYGTGAEFARSNTADTSTRAYAASAGIQVDWHFLPNGHRVDPWLSLGSGWRGYWLNQTAGITAAQGWEIARLQAGLDIRAGRDVAIGPVVGADISTFFSESTPSQTAGAVYNPWANTFFFAGLQGRFDVPTTLAKSQSQASPSEVSVR